MYVISSGVLSIINNSVAVKTKVDASRMAVEGEMEMLEEAGLGTDNKETIETIIALTN